jgi:hypothetical protein
MTCSSINIDSMGTRPTVHIKYIIAINIFLYLFSPIACFSHSLEVLDNGSAATASSFLIIDTFENEDNDGEQDCENHSCQAWIVPGYRTETENRLVLPQVVISVIVPPELRS